MGFLGLWVILALLVVIPGEVRQILSLDIRLYSLTWLILAALLVVTCFDTESRSSIGERICLIGALLLIVAVGFYSLSEGYSFLTWNALGLASIPIGLIVFDGIRMPFTAQIVWLPPVLLCVGVFIAWPYWIGSGMPNLVQPDTTYVLSLPLLTLLTVCSTLLNPRNAILRVFCNFSVFLCLSFTAFSGIRSSLILIILFFLVQDLTAKVQLGKVLLSFLLRLVVVYLTLSTFFTRPHLVFDENLRVDTTRRAEVYFPPLISDLMIVGPSGFGTSEIAVSRSTEGLDNNSHSSILSLAHDMGLAFFVLTALLIFIGSTLGFQVRFPWGGHRLYWLFYMLLWSCSFALLVFNNFLGAPSFFIAFILLSIAIREAPTK